MANYPTSLPSSTPTTHAVQNDEVVAIGTELGLSPRGSYTSVASRLVALTDGSKILSNPQGTGGLDTGVVTDALAACASAGKGRVWLGPGNWSINPDSVSVPASTVLCGAGPATRIYKTGNGVLIDLSGTGEAAMKGRAQIRDLRLEGTDFTGALIRSYHAYQAHVSDVECYGNNGPALDYAHLWDTYVTNFFAEWCSSSDGTGPTIRIRNSAAASGFGYTTDSSNELYFRNIRLENFAGAAIYAGRGVSNTADPFGFRFQNLKAETTQHRTDVNFIKVEDVRDIHIWNAILTSVGYQAAQTGQGVGVFWGPLGDSSLKQIRMYQNAARWFYGIQNYQGSGGAHIYEAIHGQGFAFGGALIRWEASNPVVVDALQVDSGTLESGTRPPRPTGSNDKAYALNAQIGTTYTAVLTDEAKMVTLSNAAAITAAHPLNSSVPLPVGSRIVWVQIGAGQVTFATGGGVTVNSRGSRLKIAGQWGVAESVKTATDTWVLSGDLVA